METAIANQIRGQQPDEVLELVLDTCKASKVTGLEKFTNLRTLTLNGCGLTTLEGFPQLPQLVRLELSDNNLSDGLEALQDACLVNLKSLSLAGNKFSTLESLEPLVRPTQISHPHIVSPWQTLQTFSQGSLPNLRDLDLFNCAVTQTDDYRKGLFELLPNLKYLDGFDMCFALVLANCPTKVALLWAADEHDLPLPPSRTILSAYLKIFLDSRGSDDNEKEEDDEDDDGELDEDDETDDLLGSEGLDLAALSCSHIGRL